MHFRKRERQERERETYSENDDQDMRACRLWGGDRATIGGERGDRFCLDFNL